jgi:hypothetical protein
MESTFSFNRKSCDGAGVSLCKGFLLAAVSASKEVQDEMNELIASGYITATYDDNMKPDGFQLSYKGSSALATIIADSDKEAKPDECYETLAKELKDIYPKGKKPGTNYYWADAVPIIVKRLKIFFKKYGNDFNYEDIVKATQAYVSSFNGAYGYMKLLKYFIFKEKKDADGECNSESELLNYLEKKDEVSQDKDWDADLR